jgi:hypothetical protein
MAARRHPATAMKNAAGPVRYQRPGFLPRYWSCYADAGMTELLRFMSLEDEKCRQYC